LDVIFYLIEEGSLEVDWIHDPREERARGAV
jgi:hypothetical protein